MLGISCIITTITRILRSHLEPAKPTDRIIRTCQDGCEVPRLYLEAGWMWWTQHHHRTPHLADGIADMLGCSRSLQDNGFSSQVNAYAVAINELQAKLMNAVLPSLAKLMRCKSAVDFLTIIQNSNMTIAQIIYPQQLLRENSRLVQQLLRPKDLRRTHNPGPFSNIPWAPTTTSIYGHLTMLYHVLSRVFMSKSLLSRTLVLHRHQSKTGKDFTYSPSTISSSCLENKLIIIMQVSLYFFNFGVGYC